MSARRSIFIVAYLLVDHAMAKDQWEQKVDDEGRNVQSLQIQAPSMTEEDQYGYTMPDQYRCDACKVVAHHLSEALKRRQPKNRRLKEWEYQETYDETCQTGLSGYGVALVDGQNVLSGPALKREDVSPGMGAIQFGGETWEKRLGEICRKFVYEKIGEDELYDHFRTRGEVSSDLCFQETRDCQLGPKAPKKAENAKKATDEKKQKKQQKQADASKAVDIDLSTFIGKLAKKHGVAKSGYTQKRSFSEWEQLFVQVAKRISDKTAKYGELVDV